MKWMYLHRETAGADGTRGFLVINGCSAIPTIEPAPGQGKGPIPEGEYRVVYTYSPRFKRKMPLLCDVPGYDGIRIHGGTKKEHTQGCICVPLNKVPIVDGYVRLCENQGEVIYLRVGRGGRP